MWHELIAAARRLRKDPWAAGAAVIVLALGTGLTTAVFAFDYGVLLRPLPYRSPSRLAMIDAATPLRGMSAWRDRLGAFTDLAGYARGTFTVRGAGEPRPVRTAVVTGEFFGALGTPPLAGRVLRDDDATVAVVSARFARQNGVSAAGMIGRPITVGTAPLTVVGVMPDVFAFPDEATDMWIPARAVPAIPLGDTADERRFRLFGRLEDAVTFDTARAQVAGARALIDPKARQLRGQAVTSLYEMIAAPVRPALLALSASALLVLLVACANTATITIGRTIARQRELAIRAAVGASAWRVFATTAAEAAIVAGVGGVLGVACALGAIRLAPLLVAEPVARMHDVRLDWPVLLFAFAAACASAAFAAAPAARALAPDPAYFREQGATRRGTRVRALLTATQIAVSMVLLTGAALLTRTVTTLLDRDIGIDTRGTLVSQVMLTDAMTFDARREGGRLETILDRVRTLPGVESAGAGSSLPPDNASLAMTWRIRTDTTDVTTPELTFSAVTSGYLQAIGARLVDGRFFDASDERGGGFGIVLSASAVRALSLPGHVAGTTLPLYLPGLRQRGHPTIVGIVRDIDYTGLEFAPGPAVYVLWHELPASQLFLAVRTRGEPAAMVSAVARAIRTADPALPIVPIRSMQAQVRRSISNRTARALFSGSGAVLAFVIAAIGLAGGLGRAVTERRRELAIRSALGATPVEVVRIVAVEAALVVGAGVVLGAVGGVAGAKLLRWALFGVTPYDPAAVAGAAALVITVWVLVSIIPARRAAALDPVELLRQT